MGVAQDNCYMATIVRVGRGSQRLAGFLITLVSYRFIYTALAASPGFLLWGFLTVASSLYSILLNGRLEKRRSNNSAGMHCFIK